MGNIFISYRRQDAPRQARAIHRLAAERFSEASVFFDVLERLEPGEDFTKVLEDRIASADVALFVIGPDWNPKAGERGRRLDETDDYVRLELATALTSAIPVIPVLVSNAAMPRARDLPTELRRFTRNEAFLLPQHRFKAAAARLVRKLDEMLTDGYLARVQRA